GIGLALSRRLAELHGGTLAARSEGPGKGSELTLRLPLAAKAATDSPHASNGSGKPSSPRRVLVVDDNVDAADSLRFVLELQGHDARVTYDAESALAAAGQLAPDFVLLDIGLPDIDGYETARRIRALPGGERMRL